MRRKLLALNLALVLAVSLLCPVALAYGVTVESDKEIHVSEAGFYTFSSHSVARCFDLKVYPVDDTVKITGYGSETQDANHTYFRALYYIPADTTVKMSVDVEEECEVSFWGPSKVTFRQGEVETWIHLEYGYSGVTLTPETTGWYSPYMSTPDYSSYTRPTAAHLGDESLNSLYENRGYNYYLLAGETYSFIFAGYDVSNSLKLKWSTRNDPVEGDDFSMGTYGYDSTELKRYNGPGGKVVVPDGVTEIDSHAFAGRTDVTEVVLPSSVKSISTNAFYACAALESVTLPCPDSERSKLYISGGAFAHCDSLTDVYFAGSQTQWDERVTVYGNNDPLENATLHCAVVDGTLESDSGVTVDWSLDRATGTVSVPAEAIPQEHQVMVVEYDEQGRFIGLRVLTRDRSSATVAEDAETLKLIWLDGDLTPQCPATPIA